MLLKMIFASRISTSFQFMDVCVGSNMFVSIDRFTFVINSKAQIEYRKSFFYVLRYTSG
jgi:hypothetical protein